MPRRSQDKQHKGELQTAASSKQAANNIRCFAGFDVWLLYCEIIPQHSQDKHDRLGGSSEQQAANNIRGFARSDAWLKSYPSAAKINMIGYGGASSSGDSSGNGETTSSLQ